MLLFSGGERQNKRSGMILLVRPFMVGICLWVAAWMSATPALAAEVSCKWWNKWGFFEKAGAADVSRCLSAGADVNARDEERWGRTPLHTAAWYNKTPAVITALVNAGADVNARAEWGHTPLHKAATFNETLAVITTLVKAGADVTARDKWGGTPLHKAATLNKNPAVITALVKAGANLDAKDKDGYTPLHTAAEFSKTPAVITALIAAGADLNARDKFGRTPLHTAAGWGKTPAVITALIAAGADLNVRDKLGRTPLGEAKKKNKPAFLAAFSQQAVATFREKARKAAAAARKREIEQRLRAARVSCGKWNTATFFKHAGAADVFRCLKTKNPNARNKYGEAPLHMAAKFSKTPAVVAALKKAGADLNARDQKGRTPLHTAAVFGKTPEIMTALIKAGADLNAKDRKGRTPLQFAEKFSQTPAVVTALQKAVAEKDKEARAARKAKAATKAAAGKRQVELGPRAEGVSCETWNTPAFFRRAVMADLSRCLKTKDPNARNRYGRTPLHYAAQGEAPKVVTALAKAGAEVNARDERGGWTPLHLAAQSSKRPEVVTALIKAGADPGAQDKKGRTPLQLAETFNKTPAIVSALKQARVDPGASPKMKARVSCETWNTPAFFRRAGPADLSRCLKTQDPNARNRYGRTPLHYAAQGEAPAVVTALAKAGAKVNARDERGGWTPLHLAAWFSKTPSVVAALLAVGADPATRDKADKTPWDYAKQNAALEGTAPYWRLNEERFR